VEVGSQVIVELEGSGMSSFILLKLVPGSGMSSFILLGDRG
jgi:hypothetical protein